MLLSFPVSRNRPHGDTSPKCGQKRHRTPANCFVEFSCISQPTAWRYKSEMCTKTTQDAHQFVFGASAVVLATACVQLGPEMFGKQHRTPANFIFWRFGGSVSDRSVHLGAEVLGKQHRTRANFWGRVFWPLLVSKCTFQGSKSISFEPATRCILFTWLKALPPPRSQ